MKKPVKPMEFKFTEDYFIKGRFHSVMAERYWPELDDEFHKKAIHVIEKSAYNQLKSELKAKDELLRECEKAIRHMHYCKYWLNKSHEDCDCNMHLIVEKLREGKG